MSKPELNGTIAAALDQMIAAGTVRPIVGHRFPLARGADAMRVIDERRATGKVVLDVPGE
jgi:NADPH2:quinone reductase